MKIKNKITLILLFMICSLASMAQMGIGTNTPNSNAALELSNPRRGMFFPRMTTLQRNAIVSPAKGLTIFNTTLDCIQTNIGTSAAVNWKCFAGISASSNGTAIVSAYTCYSTWAGLIAVGVAVTGVTQTITATVTIIGTYSISTTANGVTFAATGTFTGTGSQNIVLTATGTPTAVGSNTFTLNTTPNANFSIYSSASIYTTVTGCYAKTAQSPDVYKDFLCRNLGVTGTQDSLSYQSGANNGTLYQWGRPTDGHEVRTSLTINIQATNNTATLPSTVIGKFIYSFTDWRSVNTNTLWGDGTTGANPAKAANDPCPSGFKVPSRANWAGIYMGGTAGGSPSSATANIWTWTGNGFTVGPYLYLPAAGQRDNISSGFSYVGSNGAYWSSTISGSNVYYLPLYINGIYPDYTVSRSYGMSVRCIVE